MFLLSVLGRGWLEQEGPERLLWKWCHSWAGSPGLYVCLGHVKEVGCRGQGLAILVLIFFS